MRDLDWADVEADASRMRDQMMAAEWNRVAAAPDAELEAERYDLGIICRASAPWFETELLMLIDQELLSRHTSLCEGCLGRTGCDMCCPPDAEALMGLNYPEYDPQFDHFERFGRPAFPNEY